MEKGCEHTGQGLSVQSFCVLEVDRGPGAAQPRDACPQTLRRLGFFLFSLLGGYMHLCISFLGVDLVPLLPRRTEPSMAEFVPGYQMHAGLTASLLCGRLGLRLPGLASPGLACTSAQGTGAVTAWVGWESPAPRLTLEAHLWLAACLQVPFLLSISGVMCPGLGQHRDDSGGRRSVTIFFQT